ncbi:MAG: SCP2 sterol-binding domain-containing protein [Ilumatobacteraceae bacterium]
MRYLSDEWISAVAHEVGADPAVAAAAVGHTVAITQVVTDSPFGEVTYHLVCADGRVHFGAGPAPSDVTFRQSYDTAVAIARGELNAAESFITGKVRFSGNHETVIAAQSFFAALDSVFTRVRARTTFN